MPQIFLHLLLALAALVQSVITDARAGTPQVQDSTSVSLVKYGLFVKKVNPDFKQSMFNAEFYWWAIFENDSAKTGISNYDLVNFEYVNAVNADVNGVHDEVQETRHLGNNIYYYTGFHQGNFYFSPDYRRYPLDVQELQIIVENSLLTDESFQLLPDTASYDFSEQPHDLRGISEELVHSHNQNYKFKKTAITKGTGIYNSNFGDPDFTARSRYSRLTFTLSIDRAFVPYISKLLIPLMIILFQVYFVFFLPAHKIDIAAGLTVTSLLSAIAFQLSFAEELPEIGYIIFVDKIFYTCYFLIAMSMAQSLFTYYLDASGLPDKVRVAKKLDIAFRFIFPLLFVSSLVIFGYTS